MHGVEHGGMGKRESARRTSGEGKECKEGGGTQVVDCCEQGGVPQWNEVARC